MAFGITDLKEHYFNLMAGFWLFYSRKLWVVEGSIVNVRIKLCLMVGSCEETLKQ